MVVLSVESDTLPAMTEENPFFFDRGTVQGGLEML
jgi:hypothetical protein